MGVFKRHKISYERRLEIVFYKNKDKSYNKITTTGAYSKSEASTVRKTLLKSRTVKHLLWVGESVKFYENF